MKTTFRMMGIADYITICNGLLGVMAIVFVILAVDDMKQKWIVLGLISIVAMAWAGSMFGPALVNMFGV